MTDEFETGLDAFGHPVAPHALSPAPEVSQPAPAPSGLKKLPRVWAYLTKDARPPEPTVDAFGNPIEPTEVASPAAVKPAPGKTQDGERSAFSGDWEDEPAFDANSAAFDADAVFDTAPPDLPITHGDRPILESFSKHMGGQHGMTVTQIHQSLRWANSYEGSDADMLNNYAAHMSEYGFTPSQADEALRWFNGYAASEEALDDAAVAEVDASIAYIQSKMGTLAYTKNEKMQEAYRILLDVRDGDGDK